MLNERLIAHQKLGDIFGPGKLDAAYHAPLINEMTRFAEEAGISTRDVSGQEYALEEFEVAYLKEFHKHRSSGKAGLIYAGGHSPPVQARMRSLCGALLRNYISARFMLREELVHELWDNKRYPKFDLICVPDLSVDGLNEAPRRSVAAWLTRRMSRGQQTAIGVSSKQTLVELLGHDAPYYLQHFDILAGVKP